MSSAGPQEVVRRNQLVAAIRAVSDGGSLIDPKVVEGLVAHRARATTSPLNELTTRERLRRAEAHYTRLAFESAQVRGQRRERSKKC